MATTNASLTLKIVPLLLLTLLLILLFILKIGPIFRQLQKKLSNLNNVLQENIAGVRVVKHNETPGLGDAMETKRSDWIFAFDGKSLTQPEAKDWQVKRDGGVFDQFTGATITPRAVVKAVKQCLIYFDRHKKTLLEAKSKS